MYITEVANIIPAAYSFGETILSLLLRESISETAVLLYKPPRIPLTTTPEFGKTNFCN